MREEIGLKRMTQFFLRLVSWIATLLACIIGAWTNPIWIPFALSPTQEIIRKYSMFDLRFDTIGIAFFCAPAAVLLLIVLLLQAIRFRQKFWNRFWMVTAILYGLSIVLLLVSSLLWGIPRWNGWLIVLDVLLVLGFLSHLLQARGEGPRKL